MGRLERIKKEHIKEVNKLLDKKFVQEEGVKKEKPLRPSDNVENASSSFLDKMNRLL